MILCKPLEIFQFCKENVKTLAPQDGLQDEVVCIIDTASLVLTASELGILQVAGRPTGDPERILASPEFKVFSSSLIYKAPLPTILRTQGHNHLIFIIEKKY